jgi:DNA-binding transcriptional MerR regulator
VGLGIEEMRVMMHSRGHRPETVETKIALLTAHRGKLDAEIKNLQARKRFVENRIGYWQAVTAGDEAAGRLAAEGEVLSAHLG